MGEPPSVPITYSSARYKKTKSRWGRLVGNGSSLSNIPLLLSINMNLLPWGLCPNLQRQKHERTGHHCILNTSICFSTK